MKKNIKFEKRIDFPTMVGEISAISLEKDLKFIDESNIEGNLILSGKYKLTEASRLEEEFNYKLPIEISLTEKLDTKTSSVEISNFTYEMQDENIMMCNIELMIDGLELIEEDRECDGEGDVKEIEIPIIENKIEQNIKNQEPIKQEKINKEEVEKEKNKKRITKPETTKEEITEETETETTKEEITEETETETNSFHLFDITESDETYGTLLVYIVRENETINSIITKYNTTIEELEKYNDLKDLSIGTKLIIPVNNE